MSKDSNPDALAEAKRIMERLVKMPHKLHKDEPKHTVKGKRRPASKVRKERN